MKRLSIFFVAVSIILSILTFNSCGDKQAKGEKLAKKYCGQCHMFPEPSLLDKTTWKESVLPHMAFRMGFGGLDILSRMTEADRKVVLTALPSEPLMTKEEWKIIQEYYLREAPDSLTVPEQLHIDSLKQFITSSFRLPGRDLPLNSVLKIDTVRNKIYLGNRTPMLYTLNSGFVLEDSLELSSPAVQLVLSKDETLAVLMGIMEPSDESIGEVVSINRGEHQTTTLIDSLKRPVFIAEADLNKDNLPDKIICAFGNYTGELVAFEGTNDGYRKHILSTLPGARKVVIRDFDGNGLPDILALVTQGDEKIILFSNQGKFDFKVTTLLRFPPVYGSSFIDVADFNKDGKFDILYTNGDNADYSVILKPYHGVRLFLNDGLNQFKESWFHPMHGASQAIAHDFDKDGDLDIAAIAFFPDFKKEPEKGFVYFENNSNGFTPSITPLGASGRWISLDIADIDHDKDTDILLGALDFDTSVPPALFQQWTHDRTSILILKNTLY
ncbi:MAG TPA: VCBS repeat-containing protein [Ohtaekwangia sp.]